MEKRLASQLPLVDIAIVTFSPSLLQQRTSYSVSNKNHGAGGGVRARKGQRWPHRRGVAPPSYGVCHRGIGPIRTHEGDDLQVRKND